jgi:hypothetical protein
VRTFVCVATEQGASRPTLTYIFAEDVQRACELARRELRDARRPISIELSEGGKVIWSEEIGAA